MKTANVTRLVLSLGIAAASLGLAVNAAGHGSYLTPWRNAYPSSTIDERMTSTLGSACYTCHQPPNTSAQGTCYKQDLAARINAGRTIQQAIADIDGMDSDGDGVSNHDEIVLARTDLAGQIGYHPGLRDAIGRDPCSTTPNAPVTNTLETPPPACIADFNLDTFVNSQDFFDFLVGFFAGTPNADVNHDTFVNSQDFFDFLTHFFSGC